MRPGFNRRPGLFFEIFFLVGAFRHSMSPLRHRVSFSWTLKMNIIKNFKICSRL